jgi:hypothetical protein
VQKIKVKFILHPKRQAKKGSIEKGFLEPPLLKSRIKTTHIPLPLHLIKKLRSKKR